MATESLQAVIIVLDIEFNWTLHSAPGKNGFVYTFLSFIKLLDVILTSRLNDEPCFIALYENIAVGSLVMR